MKFTALPLSGAFLIEATPFIDHRGMLARLFCEAEMKETGLTKHLTQINLSRTATKGAVRGMHFQYPPHAETKIVRCLRGVVFDVAVDLRPNSPTYLKWHGEVLSPDNMEAMYIPEGFAHGFQALEPDSELLYLHTSSYAPHSEAGVRHDDPAISIEWPLKARDLSNRDKKHPPITSSFKGIEL